MNTDTLRVLERLDKIDAALHELDKKGDVSAAEIKTEFAKLQSQYVTQEEYKEEKRATVVTRRWTMGTVVAVLGLIFNNVADFF